MIPVSAPPRVLHRLRGAPDGPLEVLHRGRDAVYVDLHGWCVGVVARRAAALPNALRTRKPDLADLPDERAYVRRGVLHLAGRPLVAGRLENVSAPRFGPVRPPRHTAGSATAPATPPAAVVELVGSVGLRGPLAPADVADLVGRGDGLTPLGDDLLCGWLALHRAAGVATPEVDAAVLESLHRTTLLSATLLDCALHGEVLPEFAAYVSAIDTPREDATAETLARIGHTSGAGLLYGARLALAGLRGEGECAA